MLKKNTFFLSITHKFLNKLFFLIVTLLSLKISNQFYSLVMLFFVISNYFFEIISLSIPKIFNNYYKINGFEKLSILSCANLYISIFISVIFLFFIFQFNEPLLKYFEDIDNYFIFSIIIFGFSIFLNDIIDKYNFLKLNHNKIYIFDILSFVILFIILIFLFLKFNILNDENIFIIIFVFSVLQFILKFVKFFLFKEDIVFNINKIYSLFNISEIIDLVKITTPILIISILILSQLSISRFIILFFENYSSFAKFFFHMQVIELCSIFFVSIHQLSNPKISILVRNNKKNFFLILKNKLFNIFYCILPLLFLFLFFLINEIILILSININYNINLYLILSINFLLIYLFFTIYQYIIMLNKNLFLIKIVIFSLILNFIFSFIFTKLFSIHGLAFANLISNFFLFMVCNYYTKFFFFRKKDFKNLFILSLRFLVIIFFVFIYYIILNYENVFINLFLKIFYFFSILTLTEIFIPKRFRIFYLLSNFVK